jgi:curved DNA-binding protein CbpA
MAGAPPSAGDTLRAFADRIFPTLDERNYYQVLNVAPNADAAAVRAAFYRLAAQLHPDRFHTLGDVATKERLEIIYARVCEAYRVLSVAERRAAYDRGLVAGKRRLDLTDRAPAGPRNPEDALTHPEAKKFFRLAMACVGRKDWKGAVMNLTFARSFDTKSPLLAEKLAEAQAAQKAGAPK